MSDAVDDFQALKELMNEHGFYIQRCEFDTDIDTGPLKGFSVTMDVFRGDD